VIVSIPFYENPLLHLVFADFLALKCQQNHKNGYFRFTKTLEAMDKPISASPKCCGSVNIIFGFGSVILTYGTDPDTGGQLITDPV
jgi:hypothetical protein